MRVGMAIVWVCAFSIWGFQGSTESPASCCSEFEIWQCQLGSWTRQTQNIMSFQNVWLMGCWSHGLFLLNGWQLWWQWKQTSVDCSDLMVDLIREVHCVSRTAVFIKLLSVIGNHNKGTKLCLSWPSTHFVIRTSPSLFKFKFQAKSSQTNQRQVPVIVASVVPGRGRGRTSLTGEPGFSYLMM